MGWRVAGGVLIGLGHRIARTAFGAAILGVVVAIPAFAAIGFAVDRFEWVTVFICAAIFGSIGGLVVSNAGGPSWDELSDAEDALSSSLFDESDQTAPPRP